MAIFDWNALFVFEFHKHILFTKLWSWIEMDGEVYDKDNCTLMSDERLK